MSTNRISLLGPVPKSIFLKQKGRSAAASFNKLPHIKINKAKPYIIQLIPVFLASQLIRKGQ